ncbi:hypothetical protein ACFLUA_04335 [Chloroflexota bacterium]
MAAIIAALQLIRQPLQGDTSKIVDTESGFNFFLERHKSLLNGCTPYYRIKFALLFTFGQDTIKYPFGSGWGIKLTLDIKIPGTGCETAIINFHADSCQIELILLSEARIPYA